VSQEKTTIRLREIQAEGEGAGLPYRGVKAVLDAMHENRGALGVRRCKPLEQCFMKLLRGEWP
jgi:hypothetical protein